MKILFLSPALPHAQAVSGLINVNKRLTLLAARGHEIGLASFIQPGDERYVPELRAVARDLELVPLPAAHSLAGDLFGLLPGTLPAPFRAWRSPAMARAVGGLVERGRYDVLVAEFAAMGQYLYRNRHLPPVRRVVSCHSCLTTALQKAIHFQPWAWPAWRKRLQRRGLARYEFAMYRSADLVLTLTGEERFDLLRQAPELRIAVVPYGVDVEHFRPREGQAGPDTLVYTGYFAQEPNCDAVLWFARDVWPRLRARWPALRFCIVGRAPTRPIRDLAARDARITVTGEVPDVAPFLAGACIYVCPMRMGTGFRGKVLQAMAAGLPVVATTLAAEGIPAQTGANVILADTAHTFEEGINLLLTDPELRQRVGAQARDMVLTRFAWAHCVDLMERALAELGD